MKLLILALVVALSVTAQANAQTEGLSIKEKEARQIYIGGGASFPIDADSPGADMNTGYSILAGASRPVHDNIAIIAEWKYSRFNVDFSSPVTDIAAAYNFDLDTSYKLDGVNIGVKVLTNENQMRLYALGGVGFTRARGTVAFEVARSGSRNFVFTTTGFSFVVGSGLQIKVADYVSLLIDARYNRALIDARYRYNGAPDIEESDIKWLPITAMLSYSL